MKYKWKCRYQICPASEKVIFFNSFEEVNRFVRDIISKHVDLSSYIEKLKGYGNYKYFLDRAEFLTKYIEDPSFPYSEADFPLERLEDYNDYNTYFEEPEDFDDVPDIKECFDEFNDKDFYVSNANLDLNPADVDFMSDFVLPNPDTFEPLKVSFDERLDITVTKQEGWEPSAYPIMVLKVLEDTDEPMSQEKIGDKVEWRYFYDDNFYDIIWQISN